MRRARLPLHLAMLVSVLALAPMPSAQAAVTCSLNTSTKVLTVSLTSPIEPVTIVRSTAGSGDEIEVHLGNQKQACAGTTPDVNNTDTVRVADSSPGSSVVTIDLSAGPFEPGPTDEGDGTSEIEFDVDLRFGSSDELAIVGTDGPDEFALGSDGINLNAGAEGAPLHDVDVTTTAVELHTIRTMGGSDKVNASGALAPGPFPSRLRVLGGGGDDQLTGGSVADVLSGEAGEDTLVGGDGPDELLGGVNDDILMGGAGGDLLNGGNGSDVEQGEGGNDIFDQGPADNGDDVLDGGDGSLDVVAYDLRSGDVRVTLDGTADDGEAGEGDDAGETIEGILGGGGDDELIGSSADNFIRGRGGHDVLRGADGDDLLTGGGGDDLLDGGSGRDAANFFSSGGPVHVDLQAATATGQGADTLEEIEEVEGSQFGDVLVGDGGPNRLVGRGGRDLLVGRGGNDELLGGGGADTLSGDGGNDVLDGGSGRDLADFTGAPGSVSADLTLGLASGDGNDILKSVENLRGSRFGDRLVGDAGSNRLMGGKGPDRLAGRGGNDKLLGGRGNDRMAGGPGRDVFLEEAKRNGRDRMVGGGGRDLVSYAKRSRPVRVTLGGRADDGERRERDRVGPGVEEVRGGARNDLLIGNGKANRLVGGPGDDRLRGRGGRDRLLGKAGDDLLDGGPGRDRCVGGPGRNRLVDCER